MADRRSCSSSWQREAVAGHARSRARRLRSCRSGCRPIDAFTPLRSLGLGALLSGVNPKNLALTAAAAATIAQAGLEHRQQRDRHRGVHRDRIGHGRRTGSCCFVFPRRTKAAGSLASIKEFMTDPQRGDHDGRVARARRQDRRERHRRTERLTPVIASAHLAAASTTAAGWPRTCSAAWACRRGRGPPGDGLRHHRRPARRGGALHLHAADGRLRPARWLAHPVDEHDVDGRHLDRLDVDRRGRRRRCDRSGGRPCDADAACRRHPARRQNCCGSVA